MYALLKKLLFAFSPETAHHFVKTASHLLPNSLIESFFCYAHPALTTQIGEKKIANPFGLAAGFDKNAEMFSFLKALGFGFIEFGSVTALSCQGQKKPRILRLPQDESLINWMGLPNVGAEKMQENLATLPESSSYGINIAKTPDFAYQEHSLTPRQGIDDFLFTYKALHSFGTYTVFNLSCPNTEDHKTFEDHSLFSDFAKELHQINFDLKDTKPIFIKISPDLQKQKLHKLIDVALKYEFDGFVISNTTKKRPQLKSKLSEEQKTKGGLSGKALKKLADKQLKQVYDIVGTNKLLIGVGGIFEFSDILTKLRYGASLFQIYTGLIYQGPALIKNLKRQLAEFCEKEGVTNYRELVGKI